MDFDRGTGRTQEHDGTTTQDGVLQLGANATAPGLARRFLEEHRDHLPPDLVDDAALALTELVTNAVQHGQEVIRVRVRAAPSGIGLAVSDGGPPVSLAEVHPSASLDQDATSGRGLGIVDALASRWGVTPNPDAPGKTVWVELLNSS